MGTRYTELSGVSKVRIKSLKRWLGIGSVKKVVFVLGMHRSGTSWFTGALQQAGLHLGNHHTWNPHNLKGNRENPDVYDLHESILEFNGASWDKPPHEKVIWTDEHCAAALKIINDTEGQGTWGVKDPRTLFLLDGWKELIIDLRFVGIFRHPFSVWSSLNARGAIEKYAAFSMWLQYNKRLLDEYNERAFPLLCFDWSERVLHDRFYEICEDLGLSTDRHHQDFYSSDLRRNTETSDESLPEQVAQTYHRLRELSEKG